MQEYEPSTPEAETHHYLSEAWKEQEMDIAARHHSTYEIYWEMQACMARVVAKVT